MKILLIILVIVLSVGGIFFVTRRLDGGLTKNKNIIVSSNSFTKDQEIPVKFTCEGENINPDLSFENVPAQAKSLLLEMKDLDGESGVFTHWIVWNINPGSTTIPQKAMFPESVSGKNDFGSNAYEGPCPSMGKHDYVFRVYALDSKLDLAETSTVKEVEKAISKKIIDSGEISGFYTKKLN